MIYNLVDSYSVTSVNSVDLTGMRTAQFTLNGRIHPSRRNSAELTRRLCRAFPKVNIVVHYDYIHLIGKVLIFNSQTQQSILEELSGLLNLDEPNFVGVVMHTSSCFRKGFKEALDKLSFIQKNYNLNKFSEGGLLSYWTLSDEFLIEMGLNRLFEWCNNSTKKPIILENMASSNIKDPVSSLLFIKQKYPKGMVGVCYDTEHAYASIEKIPLLQDTIDAFDLVHLNAIPEGVSMGSKLDRHSDTTLLECSVVDFEVYEKLIIKMNELSIPYIREVTEETIIREQSQLAHKYCK